MSNYTFLCQIILFYVKLYFFMPVSSELKSERKFIKTFNLNFSVSFQNAVGVIILSANACHSIVTVVAFMIHWGTC